MGSHLRPKSALAALAAGLLLAGPLTRAVQADAIPLTFSGGSGSPLTITLNEPVTYTITAPPSIGFLFDFKGVGNVFGGTLNVSGTMTYTVNGGAAISINAGDTGFPVGAIAANDLILFHNPLPAAALGDVVTLSPGSLTTAINIAAGAPASGPYDAILVDPNGAQVSVGVSSMRTPGDFDLDGNVDGADLTKWQGDFGPNGGSDADGDGNSDGADFLTWQRHLVIGAAVSREFTIVPEPLSLCLSAFGAVALFRSIALSRSALAIPGRRFLQ
jgi:hypothetical protein